MMRTLFITLAICSVTPAWALTPQTALPRPIACASDMTRVAALDRPDQRCPQWLSTGGVLAKRTIRRG